MKVPVPANSSRSGFQKSIDDPPFPSSCARTGVISGNGVSGGCTSRWQWYVKTFDPKV